MIDFCVCFLDNDTGYYDELFLKANNAQHAYDMAMLRKPVNYRFNSVFPVVWA